MNAISSFIPGIMGSLQRQTPAVRLAISSDFAGLLDRPANAAQTVESQTSAAREFAELGMFGRSRAQAAVAPDEVSRNHGAAAAETAAALAPQSSAAPEGKSAPQIANVPAVSPTRASPPSRRPDPQTHKNGSEQDIPHPSEEATVAARCAWPPATGRMAQPAAKSLENEASGGAGNNPVAKFRAAVGAAQQAVHLSMSLSNGRAEIIARGHAEAPELAARVRAALAEHDLELGNLRLNGNDEPLRSQFQVGGKRGNRPCQ